MPSSAEPIGFPWLYDPWAENYRTPATPPIPPVAAWWLQTGSFPSSDTSSASNPSTETTRALASGGLFGDHPIVRGASSTASRGILQDLYPDKSGEAPQAIPVSGWPDFGPFHFRNDAGPGAADSVIQPNSHTFGVWPAASRSNPDGEGTFSQLFATPPLGSTVPSAHPYPFVVSSFPQSGFTSLSADLASARNADLNNSAPAPLASASDLSRSEEFAPTNINASSSTAETAETSDWRGAYPDTAANEEPGDSDASFARSYDRAQATIAADPELRSAVAMAEKAGDKDFNHRLATIMADLDRDPEAALDAIRHEVFNSQIRNRAGASASAAVAALATWNAINRLDVLRPTLGILQAREEGFRPAVNLSADQQRTLYRIATDSKLSPGERLDQMGREGLFDVALASSLLGGGGGAYRGRPPRPPTRTSENLSGSPPEAKPAEPSSAFAFGPKEPRVGSDDLERFRSRIGVPSRETVAVARTNVPGLQEMTFEGASPGVRYEARLPRAAPGPITSPSKNPFRREHAEEDLANQLVRAIDERGLKASDLDGYTLAIHISNPNGVCATCRLGLASAGPAGVLKQLSQRYPGLSIRITVEKRPEATQRGPTDFTIRNGRYVGGSEQ